MRYQIAALSVLLGIAIGSFCIGQGKQTVKNQVASDVKVSDHDRIERLSVQVAELQKKVAELTQEYETHTHQLQNLKVGQMPDYIECDENVVQWSSTGTNREPVYKACRQLGSGGKINILVQGKEPIAIGPPRP